ncbi:extracellular solute-binding protein, family 5 [Alkaliphilus metalliredigens QYMF]|uniref:Extracellular solute-binding protein, family 5 n=1 Tax=Alkaliphilus metalliredigens (strain QYMF) TaxID=293826 RepID=A6TPC8_ALKMQ|nr:ABC transporter substrate-binding protein [Alkaliphilus metalliredigens]ABR48046.1 extracellular solute-binding protein, family 5 [Alkaliphilus metalliredigens QYMF]
MKKIMLAAVMLILVLSLIACNSIGEPSSVEGVKRLTVAQMAEPASLDVAAVSDVTSYWVIEQTGDRLVRLDNDMNLVPDLAENWEWIDDLTLEFYLREGVKFHNGEDFTAHDVEFTLKRRLDPDFGSPNFAFARDIDVDSIEVVDDYTIRFSTSRPYAPILFNMAHSSGVILNQKAVEEHGEDYGQNPVGTGPFKFVEWTPGNHVLLERFDEYWGGPADYEELQFRFITSSSNRLIELETGNVHIAESIAPSDLGAVESNNNMSLMRGMSVTTNYFGLNNNREPFNDVRVRQAMNYAIDVDTLIGVVYEGLGSAATAPMNTQVLDPGDRSDEIYQYGYDPDKARELLEEAGYPDGFEFSIMIDSNDTRVHTAEIVQNYLGEIGIKANIENVEWAVLLERAGNENDYDAVIMSWTTSTGDPEMASRPFYPPFAGAAGNRVFYQNHEVETILTEAMAETDISVREDMYIDAQIIIAQEAPWVFLHFGEQAVGIRSSIEGFELHPGQRHRLYDVRFSD